MIDEITDKRGRESELANCNFVKTVLMLLVVVYHSILYWNNNWFVGTPVFLAPALSVFAEWLNSFHIYAFTLVSGYLFYYLKCETGRYNQFLPYVKNKIKRLLIPYIFVSLIWVVPFAVYFFQYSAVDVIIKFGLGTSPNQLWFLLMLFGVFIIFYLLSGFFEKNNVKGAVLALVFYGIGLIGQKTLPNIIQCFRACTYIPLFWLGFKIRQHGSHKLRRIPSVIWLLADVALFVLMYAFSKQEGVIFELLHQGTRLLVYMVGALMAFIVLQKLADRVSWKKSKMFGIITKNSMAVYLLHQQVIYVFISLLNGMINPYVHACVNFAGSMVISLLISGFLMKFKWTRILIGEK